MYQNNQKPNSSKKNSVQQPPNTLITAMIWIALILLCLQILKNFGTEQTYDTLSFQDFVSKIKNKEIKSVVFEGPQTIYGEYNVSKELPKPKKFKTIGDTKSELYQKLLMDNGIVPSYKEEEKPSILLTLFLNFFPLILIGGFAFYFLSKGASGGASKLTSIGQIKAKPTISDGTSVKFADVAGCDEAKEDLQEFVEFLSNPTKFTKLGGKLPKGALLVGPPGTGKTLLARAVANEAGVPFFSLSGSDFVEMFVGVGASRVRDLFAKAKEKAPCIIFIDELDAVGKARGNGNPGGGGNDEREQTLNQLLVQMDGFDSQKGIIVLAATNRIDVLDAALLRPGRFDRRVTVGLPDIIGREKILTLHANKTKLEEGTDLKPLAKGTPGFSGADLANLINEAALLAARKNKESINNTDLEEARDKILMGPQRNSMQISEEEKRITACHEAGHALIAKFMEVDTIHKVTIIPRGQALGVTQTLPEGNRLSYSETYAKNLISMLMGGRIAEELIYNHFTTGASNDIEKATDLARRMVCEWGMSPLGPINYYTEANPFAAKAGAHDFSPETKKDIDNEIKKIIANSYEAAKKLITEKKNLLISLTDALMEKETLDGTEVHLILDGKTIS